jgi:hypothetical protein
MRRFYRRRNVDRDEAVGREHVCLAALVDNADISVPLGSIVAEDDVDLVPLQRGFVAVFVHADGEVVTVEPALCDSLEVPLALELFFADAMCFIPMQFGESKSDHPEGESARRP